MPSDVEKVAICRLTGARATEACRHPEWYAPAVLATTFLQNGLSGSAGTPSASVEENEPPVYEDLFPAGTVPTQPCPVHGVAGASPAASGTPLVDAALQQPVAGAVVRTGARLFVEKTTGRDGIIRYVVTQR